MSIYIHKSYDYLYDNPSKILNMHFFREKERETNKAI